MNRLLQQFLPFFLILLSVLSSMSLVNTITGWVFNFILLTSFLSLRANVSDDSGVKRLLWVQLYLVYIVLQFIRGGLISRDYWDWKALVDNVIALFAAMVVYLALDVDLLRRSLRIYAKYGVGLFLVLLLVLSRSAYGFYLPIVLLILLAVPYLEMKQRIIFVGLGLLAALADFSTRSSVIKFGMVLMILPFYDMIRKSPREILELARKVLFVMPLLLLFLAVTGTFNVFRMNDYLGDDNGAMTTATGENLKEDTRTGLYVEVLNTAKKYDSWWLGRSPAYGNETELFADIYFITGRAERQFNEVGILNIFNWTGIVGVFLYQMCFYRASWLALNNSNNAYMKWLGILVAFRWCYSWVEDLTMMNAGYVALWLMIGMCYSDSLRKMSDDEIGKWFRSLFEVDKPVLNARSL